MTVSDDLDESRGAAAVRWAAAGGVIALVHAGALWAAAHWLTPAGAPPGAAELMLIDLEPPPAADRAQPEAAQETLPEPTPEMAETPPSEKTPDVEPEPPRSQEPPPLEPAPPEPAPVPPPEPPAPQAEAVLPPPRKPPPTAKPVERKADRRRAPPKAARQPSAVAGSGSPAVGATSASPAQRATWQAQVAAHLNRYKRAPANGAAGVARVAFRVGGNGQVISATLAGSSGDPALDQEALSLVRRASPLPAPPPGLGASISLVVPIRFTR